jgi:trans-aconitate methyltransferase
MLATDIGARWIQGNGLSQLQVQRHDVVADPLAQGEFDFVHARLVLSWLPARDAVVPRLVAALRPGGWLVVEDFDSVLHHCLDPLNDDERVFDKVTDASGRHFSAGAPIPPGRALCPTVSPRPGSKMSARPGT